MKNNLKLLFSCVLVCLTSTQFVAQTMFPKEKIEAKAHSLLERIKKTDSLTNLTDPVEKVTDSIAGVVVETEKTTPIPSNETIIRTVYDGSKNLNQTRTLKYANVEEVILIGAGSFQNILYVDKLNNQVIKAKHVDSMKYMYNVGEDEKSNTERIEVNLYYENEKLFYAVFKEDHYKKETELLFSNEYRMEMTAFHKDVYFTNDFQKTIYKYIQDMSASILSQK